MPSKVLSYLAVGRPVLGFLPADNPCASDIVEAGGRVVPPDDEGVREASRWLADLDDDWTLAEALGRRSRALAEEKFDVDSAVDAFSALARAVRRDSVSA